MTFLVPVRRRWKYWNQPPIPLINRMRVEADAAHLRREGQPVRDKDGRIIEAERAAG